MKFYWCSYDVDFPEGSETIDTSFFRSLPETLLWFRSKKEDAREVYSEYRWRENSYIIPKGWKATCCTSGVVSLYSFEIEL